MIKVGDEKKIELEQEEWTKLLAIMKKKAGPKCTKCKRPPTEGDKLQHCSRCKKAQYYSRDCQKADWKKHKVACKYLSKDLSIGGMDYYQNGTVISPEAHALAREIGLSLRSHGGNGSLR